MAGSCSMANGSASRTEIRSDWSPARALKILLFSVGVGTIIAVALAPPRFTPGGNPIVYDYPSQAQVEAARKIETQQCMHRRSAWVERETGFRPKSLLGIITTNGLARLSCVFD